jgi:hypothetical protein
MDPSGRIVGLDHDIYSEARSKQSARDLSTMLKKLRPVTTAEYIAWLQGYIKQGGRVTSVNKNMSSDKVYVAPSGIEVLPLHGTDSITILIPRGPSVKISSQGPGHNTILCMKGFEVVNGKPVQYRDTQI